MEPKIPSPQFNPETPVNTEPSAIESIAGSLYVENESVRAEKPATSMLSTVPPAVSPVLPTPVNLGGDQGDGSQSSSVVSGINPSVAGDDDLIEKEWVDRTKKIISATKDDPRQREEEVSRLKVDYLQKRYGRELGVADES